VSVANKSQFPALPEEVIEKANVIFYGDTNRLLAKSLALCFHPFAPSQLSPSPAAIPLSDEPPQPAISAGQLVLFQPLAPH
jgi:hypothetical protein